MSFNCNGFRSAEKEIFDMLDSCDIMCLQELMICKQDCPVLQSFHNYFYGHATSPVDDTCGILQGRPYGGVGVMWRKSLNVSVSVINDLPNWMCGIRVQNANNIYYLFNLMLMLIMMTMLQNLVN